MFVPQLDCTHRSKAAALGPSERLVGAPAQGHQDLEVEDPAAERASSLPETAGQSLTNAAVGGEQAGAKERGAEEEDCFYYSFCPDDSHRFVALDCYDVNAIRQEPGPDEEKAEAEEEDGEGEANDARGGDTGEEGMDVLSKHNPNRDKNNARGMEGLSKRYAISLGGPACTHRTTARELCRDHRRNGVKSGGRALSIVLAMVVNGVRGIRIFIIYRQDIYIHTRSIYRDVSIISIAFSGENTYARSRAHARPKGRMDARANTKVSSHACVNPAALKKRPGSLKQSVLILLLSSVELGAMAAHAGGRGSHRKRLMEQFVDGKSSRDSRASLSLTCACVRVLTGLSSITAAWARSSSCGWRISSPRRAGRGSGSSASGTSRCTRPSRRRTPCSGTLRKCVLVGLSCVLFVPACATVSVLGCCLR